MAWNVPAPGGGGGGGSTEGHEEDEFFPTVNGQTVFTLTRTPNLNMFIMSVNGNARDKDTDFTVSGVVVTWLDNGYTLDMTDKIIFVYTYNV